MPTPQNGHRFGALSAIVHEARPLVVRYGLEAGDAVSFLALTAPQRRLPISSTKMIGHTRSIDMITSAKYY